MNHRHMPFQIQFAEISFVTIFTFESLDFIMYFVDFAPNAIIEVGLSKHNNKTFQFDFRQEKEMLPELEMDKIPWMFK